MFFNHTISYQILSLYMAEWIPPLFGCLMFAWSHWRDDFSVPYSVSCNVLSFQLQHFSNSICFSRLDFYFSNKKTCSVTNESSWLISFLSNCQILFTIHLSLRLQSKKILFTIFYSTYNLFPSGFAVYIICIMIKTRSTAIQAYVITETSNGYRVW